MNFETLVPIVLKAIAVFGAFIAMITDLKWGKIYNWLTFPLFFLGWCANAYFLGLAGFISSFVGSLLGIAFYLGFALMGAFGMGDVKLMGAIGALGGIKFVVSVFLYTSVIGIPHALIIQYLNYGKEAWGMLLTSYHTKAFLEKTIHLENRTKVYHYYLGLDILLGTLLAVFIEIPLGF